MTDLELVKSVVKALDSKKAQDIKIIRIGDLTILGNYFVIAEGSSTTQVKTLSDETQFQLEQKGVVPKSVQGHGGSQWIVLDYVDVIVHIFYGETRRFYDLERLWQDGEMLSVQDFLD